MMLNPPPQHVHFNSLVHSDLSFAALQHQRFGSVTNSMILAVGFRAVIVVEYFLYEDL
jgi:hypothetical protein